jgi:hypothetical protein
MRSWPEAQPWKYTRSSRDELFWNAQQAISRGISVRRLFIYETLTQELRDLVNEHVTALHDTDQQGKSNSGLDS